MKRPWRVVPLRAGGSLWWVIFWYGEKKGRVTSLDQALRFISKQPIHTAWHYIK